MSVIIIEKTDAPNLEVVRYDGGEEAVGSILRLKRKVYANFYNPLTMAMPVYVYIGDDYKVARQRIESFGEMYYERGWRDALVYLFSQEESDSFAMLAGEWMGPS